MKDKKLKPDELKEKSEDLSIPGFKAVKRDPEEDYDDYEEEDEVGLKDIIKKVLKFLAIVVGIILLLLGGLFGAKTLGLFRNKKQEAPKVVEVEKPKEVVKVDDINKEEKKDEKPAEVEVVKEKQRDVIFEKVEEKDNKNFVVVKLKDGTEKTYEVSKDVVLDKNMTKGSMLDLELSMKGEETFISSLKVTKEAPKEEVKKPEKTNDTSAYEQARNNYMYKAKEFIKSSHGSWDNSLQSLAKFKGLSYNDLMFETFGSMTEDPQPGDVVLVYLDNARFVKAGTYLGGNDVLIQNGTESAYIDSLENFGAVTYFRFHRGGELSLDEFIGSIR